MNEAELLKMVRNGQEIQCMEGDVTDGSVDYYDFDWGEAVLVEESAICSGCQGARQAYGDCMAGCGACPDPDPEPCIPTLPAQVDDPGYDIVEP